MVVSGGTRGIFSSWRNIHLTVVRKQRQRVGQLAQARGASRARPAAHTNHHAGRHILRLTGPCIDPTPKYSPSSPLILCRLSSLTPFSYAPSVSLLVKS